MLLSILGVILMVFGLLVSIIFWIPSIIDRGRLKTTLGRRYSLIYVIYFANGPLLMVCGFLLVVWQKS